MDQPLYHNMQMNNIVFEGRNHAYGAYLLRRRYPRNMTLSFFLATILFLMLISLAYVLDNKKEEIIEIFTPVVLENDIPVPPKPKPILKPQSSSPSPVSQKPTNSELPILSTNVQSDNIHVEPQPARETQFISNSNGIDSTNNSAEIDQVGSSKGAGENVSNSVTNVEEPLPSYGVEQLPQFPDGEKALQKYIQKNFDIPQSASEIGESLTVYIQFIVDKDGSIYDVKIRRSNMPMVNAEAVEVVKEMPNWIPGKHNGKPVKVIMTLPIKIQFQ